MKIRQKGFTLIELMTTVAVLGILAALALPSFKDTIENNRLRGAVTDANSRLNAAFAEGRKITSSDTRLYITVDTTKKCIGFDVIQTAPSNNTCDCTLTPGINGACQTTPFKASDYSGVSITYSAGNPLEVDNVRGYIKDYDPASPPVIQLSIGTTKTVKITPTLNGQINTCTTTGVPGYKPCS